MLASQHSLITPKALNHADCIEQPTSFKTPATAPKLAFTINNNSTNIQQRTPQDTMEVDEPPLTWNFGSAFEILRSAGDVSQSQPVTLAPTETTTNFNGLGDFSAVWRELGLSPGSEPSSYSKSSVQNDIPSSVETEFAQLVKAVKWRDEHDGADLEDNVEPELLSASNLRTRKRAARRARARERELAALKEEADQEWGTATDDDDSGEELESLRRRSPDRRSLIAGMLGRPRPEITPPTSPSPPKESSILRKASKKEWPVANPFLWQAPSLPAPSAVSKQQTVMPADGLTSRLRKINLINHLTMNFPEERKYLGNQGLQESAFSPLNTSPIGVHVFIDVSNISIGFHDCLKLKRGIPIATRVRRIPMSFHNLSLVLERGRPAAKRILAGSDRTPVVDAAEICGYETNILDRVHKMKTPTPKKKHYSGYASASGISHGETSGSETPGYLGSVGAMKWSEQAVDEILHLKMSHSLLDAEKPSTIVLATGDAAEAEYSDGFLRMVERALAKGWMVELVSFKMNTSNLYKRREFRQKWGNMFKWIQLDDYAESLIESDEYR